jgi:hypothetical protein
MNNKIITILIVGAISFFVIGIILLLALPIPCKSGTYSVTGKTGLFGKPCTICPENTYSYESSIQCINCPEGTISSAGSSDIAFCIPDVNPNPEPEPEPEPEPQPEPPKPECMTNSDCMSGSKRVCDSGKCVECSATDKTFCSDPNNMSCFRGSCMQVCKTNAPCYSNDFGILCSCPTGKSCKQGKDIYGPSYCQ